MPRTKKVLDPAALKPQQMYRIVYRIGNRKRQLILRFQAWTEGELYFGSVRIHEKFILELWETDQHADPDPKPVPEEVRVF